MVVTELGPSRPQDNLCQHGPLSVNGIRSRFCRLPSYAVALALIFLLTGLSHSGASASVVPVARTPRLLTRDAPLAARDGSATAPCLRWAQQSVLKTYHTYSLQNANDACQALS